jgi:hypothetical protein
MESNLFYVISVKQLTLNCFTQVNNLKLVEYANACYISDLPKGQSKTKFLFTCGNTVISWRSIKQIIVVTSSKRLKIIAA